MIDKEKWFYEDFGLVQISFYSTVLCSTINVACIIFMVAKAPKEMRVQSRYIVYANFGAVIYDMISGLLCPLRAMTVEHGKAYRFAGLLELWNVDLRVQTLFLLLTAWHMSFALHGIFVGALLRILPTRCRKRSMTKIIGVISLLNGATLLAYYIMFFLLGDTNQYTIIGRTLVVKTKTPTMISALFCVVIALCCLAALIALLHWHLKNEAHLSVTTTRRQKMLLKNSVIQFLVPLLFYACPVAVRMIALRVERFRSDALIEYATFVQTFYGSLFTLTTIVLYRPYRRFFTEKLESFIDFSNIPQINNETRILVVENPISS